MKKATQQNFSGYSSIFAIRLSELMKEYKKTQQDIAELVGTSRQAVAQYTDGSTQPTIERLYKIANYFQVSADYLLGISDIKSIDLQDKEISRILGLSEEAIEKLKTIQLKIEKAIKLNNDKNNTEEFHNLYDELYFLEGTIYAINTLLSDSASIGTRAIDSIIEYLLFNENEFYNISLNNTTYTASGEKVSYFLIDELHNKLKALKLINYKGTSNEHSNLCKIFKRQAN
ncbi:MAG: helix-turn-helix domain-containing protein [Clostridia bacterium]|nr:helix-turn-helix domain-containing protein [Clostridia bacterium]